MKNLSTGTGLALLATAIVAYPLVNRISSVDQTAHASVPVAAIAAAATAQANPEPTIVWYGTMPGFGYSSSVWFALLLRAWSDGTVEAKAIEQPWWGTTQDCDYSFGQCGWRVVSSPNQGFNAAADINFDSTVDGADLATMITHWGDAPRHDIPPSDCPLNLINP